MGKIEIEGMEFYAFHGYFDAEKRIGNRFTVDLSMKTDLEQPSISDDLSQTINYQMVYNIVKAEMAVPSNLLEHVAGRIVRHIKADFPEVKKLRVKIAKMAPPMGGEMASVSVTLFG
jgi:dihydroneopterin aldolase